MRVREIAMGDYYIPDIRLSNTTARSLGKYGRMRRTFLEENNTLLFAELVIFNEIVYQI